jgi:hypothetical protein
VSAQPALRLVEGGASNSRPSPTTWTHGGAGFDTVRLRFRDQEHAYELARRSGNALHARGELRRCVDGVTIGTYPDGMVYVEGRLAALLHGPDDHRLLSAAELTRAPAVAAERFRLDATLAVAVGRADLASELRFSDGRDGLELLRAASYVDLPWLKVGTEGGKRNSLETVYWRTVNGRSVVMRMYDKGRETGSAAPGEWIRLERQRRWRKAREQTVVEVIGSPHSAFVGRELARLVDGVDRVDVCNRWGAVERLRELQADGTLSGEMHAKLVGYVVSGGPGLKRSSAYAWASRLRQLGIALNPNEGGRSVVPIGEYVRAFADRWVA